jgi:ABC-type branched-subunit amino acid transport system ATPase component
VSALAPSAASALRCYGITKQYSGRVVLHGVSIEVASGGITALIGPNGAGKSTLFDILAGFVRPDSGTVVLKDRDITRLPAHKRARLGICKTFQIPHEFGDLTVEENLLLCAPRQTGERFPAVLYRHREIANQEAVNRRRAKELLEFLGLYSVVGQRASQLSVGQKKLLEAGRALMLGADILLLDEPLAGVRHATVERLLEHILEIKASGKTLLVVEHNLEAIMRIADSVHVLVDGRLIASGPPSAIQSDERVLGAYLGDYTTSQTLWPS